MLDCDIYNPQGVQCYRIVYDPNENTLYFADAKVKAWDRATFALLYLDEPMSLIIRLRPEEEEELVLAKEWLPYSTPSGDSGRYYPIIPRLSFHISPWLTALGSSYVEGTRVYGKKTSGMVGIVPLR